VTLTRSLYSSLAALAFACGGATDTTDKGQTTPAGDPDALVLTLSSGDFSYCECHHGFGPGVNGSLELRIQNPSSRARTLDRGALTLSGATRAYSTIPPGFRMVPEDHQFMNDGSVPGVTIPAGASARLFLSAYIDGPSAFADVAGRRQVRVELLEGGRSIFADTEVDVADHGKR